MGELYVAFGTTKKNAIGVGLTILFMSVAITTVWKPFLTISTGRDIRRLDSLTVTRGNMLVSSRLASKLGIAFGTLKKNGVRV